MHIFRQPGDAFMRLLILIAMLAVPMASFAQQTDDAVSKYAAPDAANNPDLTQNELQLLMLPLPEAELAELADVWQGHLRNKVMAGVMLNLKLANTSGGEARNIREGIVTTTTETNLTLGKYRTVLAEWERKGADPAAFEPYAKYASAVTSELFEVSDYRALIRIAKAWLFSAEGGLGFIIKLATGLVGFVAVVLLARFIRRVATRAIERIPTMSQLLKSFVLKAAYWLTLATGIVLILAVVGVNVTPLFAVFGGISFILAFALQDTLGNLASGLMIMVLKPFDTGDLIHVSGTSGIVDNVSVIATTIRTFDNQIIVVPNSKVWGDVITNVNAAPERRVDLVFGIGYTDSAPKAIEILTTLIEQNKLCLTDPAPSIFVGELADSSVNIFCRPWVKTADYWTVYWDLLSQAKDQFDAQGISIPYPQRDVHVYQVTDQTDS